MTLEIIGAGFGRTGTLSLKAALEELGFNKCYHMVELFENPEGIGFWENASQGKPVDWDTLFRGYKAIVDFPGCSFYEQLMKRYPDAKVILTVRDPESWYESCINTIYRVRPSLKEKFLTMLQLPFSARQGYRFRQSNFIEKTIWQGEFQDKFEDKDFAIGVFNRHIEAVKRAVPAEKLLVYQVKEGWKPLCDFLEVPSPDKPFPRLNDKETFQQRSKQLSSDK